MPPQSRPAPDLHDDETPGTEAGEGPAHPGLILAVFIVASCGLAYELIAGALASYLLGESVLRFSTIIGAYLFAMGIGSHLSKYVDDRVVLARFIDIELMIGLLGGLSACALFLIYAWAGAPFRVSLYAIVLMIGVLVGMEIPLVMRLLHQRKQAFEALVSRVLTFDYLGALAVSLLFPLVLAPLLGLARTAVVFGVLNAGIGLWVTHRYRTELPQAGALMMRGWLVLAVLLAALVWAQKLTDDAEASLYGDSIVHQETTPFQRIVLTRWLDDTRLYLNGNLQFSTRDEHRYHEALVHPALAALPGARRVLVLGGGDGLAVREVLKYPQIEQVTLVELDPAMTRLFRDHDELAALNGFSLRDRRVTTINADAAQWLETAAGPGWDLIIADFPDPSHYALGKLYSVPMYRLMKRHLAAGGLIAVQSTSPWYAPHAFWCVDATLREAGLHTAPYHAEVPSFGDWGFIIAGREAGYRPPAEFPDGLRHTNAATVARMFAFPPDMAAPRVEPNRLNTQMLVHYFEQDWSRQTR
jgi:spermidine synthase